MVKKNVADVLAKRVRESRSPLYQWLHENYDQIAPIITSQPRPAWEALAKTVGETSKLPRPSRQGVKKAWMKLMQDKEKTAATPKPQTAAAQERLNSFASQPPQSPVAQSEQVSGFIEPDQPKPSRRNFALSTPKKEI